MSRFNKGRNMQDDRPDFGSDDERDHAQGRDIDQPDQSMRESRPRLRRNPTRGSTRLHRAGGQPDQGFGEIGSQRSMSRASRPSGLDVSRANEYNPQPRDYPKIPGAETPSTATDSGSRHSTPAHERAERYQYQQVQADQQLAMALERQSYPEMYQRRSSSRAPSSTGSGSLYIKKEESPFAEGPSPPPFAGSSRAQETRPRTSSRAPRSQPDHYAPQSSRQRDESVARLKRERRMSSSAPSVSDRRPAQRGRQRSPTRSPAQESQAPSTSARVGAPEGNTCMYCGDPCPAGRRTCRTCA